MKFKPEHVKMIVKFAASGIFSLAIGYTYKAGKKVDARIDEYFASPEPETTDQDN